jgi:hypothetical protein
VHDAQAVQVGERVAQLRDDAAHRHLGQAAVPLQQVLAVAALDQVQHKSNLLAALVQTAEADDVRVDAALQHAGLVLEGAQHQRPPDLGLPHGQLHRHSPAVLAVVSGVDCGGAAVAEARVQLVPPDERSTALVQHILRHGRHPEQHEALFRPPAGEGRGALDSAAGGGLVAARRPLL